VFAATEIYHFAAQAAVTKSLEDPRTDFEVNAGGTVNILEAARRSGNRPFVLFTSTSKVYGHIRPAHSARPTFDNKGDNEVVTVRESQLLEFYSPYACSKGPADQRS
jgi:CDP-paratose 2-epimerase